MLTRSTMSLTSASIHPAVWEEHSEGMATCCPRNVGPECRSHAR
jgi:hypothetical protein